jgi:Leucine-rich repeat (LRR) protein
MKIRTVVVWLVVAAVSLFLIRAAWLEHATGERGAIFRDRTDSIAYSLNSSSAYMDLAGQSMRRLPDELFERTDLVELDLSGNELTAIPAEIRHLQKLEVLSFANNELTGIPAELGQLRELRILDLSTNPITGLPYELGNLSKLEVLDLRGTNYSEVDLAVILESLPETVTVYTNPKEPDQQP